MRAVCALLALLSITSSEKCWAVIGDVTDVISTSVSLGQGFAFDPSTGQFHTRRSANIYILDGAGNVLKQGNLDFSWDGILDQGLSRGFVLDNATTWVGLGTDNVLRKWAVEEEPGGDIFLTEVQQTDLSSLLSFGWRIDGLAKADSSSYWVSVTATDGFPDQPILLRISNDGLTLLSQINLFENPVFGFGAAFNTGTGRNRITADGAGNLVMLVNGAKPGMEFDAQAFSAFYYYLSINGNEIQTLGRFELPDVSCSGGFQLIAGGAGRLYMCDTGGISGFELSATQLPELTSLDLDPEGVLLRSFGCDWGIDDITKTMSVAVEWRGVPGRVQVRGEYPSTVQDPIKPLDYTLVSTNGDAVTIPYDVDSNDLIQAPFPLLHVEVMNNDGQSSGRIELPGTLATYNRVPFGIESPGPNICNFVSYENVNRVAKWSVAARWPPIPLSGNITFPTFLPFVGGEKFGLKDFSAELIGAVASTGTDKVTVTGGGVFELGPGEIAMRLGGGAGTELKPDRIDYPSGIINFLVSGTVKKEVGLFDAFPPVVTAPIRASGWFGPAIALVNKVAKLEAALSLAAQTTATLTAHPVSGDLSVSGENEYALSLTATAFSNISKNLVQAAGYGQGKASVVVGQSPDDPGNIDIKKLILRFVLSAKVVVFGAVREFAHPYMWEYDATSPSARQQGAASFVTKAADSQWRYRYGSHGGPRSQVTLPALANANPYATLRSSRTAKGTALEENQEVIIMDGVSSLASPVSASSPAGHHMVLWEQEVAGLPSTQATDIYFSYFNGSTYSPPSPIAIDTHADFAPDIAYHKSGVWVALWSRVNLPNLQPTGDALLDAEAQYRDMVPAYAVFNPQNGTWNNVQNLSEQGGNAMLQLATGPTNDITALWVNDPDGRLVPYDVDSKVPFSPTTQPGQEVLFSLFEVGGFQPTRTANLVAGSAGLHLLDLAAADSGQQVAIAGVRLFSYTEGAEFQANADLFVARMNRDSSSNNFFTDYSNQNSLSTRVRLGPEILAMNDGSWRLAWKQFGDSALYRVGNASLRITDDLQGLVNNNRILLEDPRAYDQFEPTGRYRGSRWNDAVLTDIGAGRTVAIVPDYPGGSANLSLIFDDPADTPSGLDSLQFDDAIEKSISVSQSTDGTLLVTYLKTGLDRSTEMVDEGAGQIESYPVVNESALGSIAVTEHRVFRDLVAKQTRIVGGKLEQGFDATLDVTIENRGDLSVVNPKVSVFVEGEVTRGSMPIPVAENILVVDGIMPGNSEATITVPWIVPGDGAYTAFAVVDPNNEIAEDFEDNNNQTPVPLDDDLELLLVANFE